MSTESKAAAATLEVTSHPSALGVMYHNWFLDYASYVILERAIPHIQDGLKPVQRRLLHALYELDDGRFNKAANVIGHTMRYHPHGDMSIGDALVQLGQKNLLLDLQGNWGNPETGDSAAAPRYIEVRLNAFAKDILFNPSLTDYLPSYDGRNQEPVILPAKFPLLLMQGVEGIAVGLSCRLLPHNFNEIIDGCIAHLKGKRFQLLPDFASGGLVDARDYNQGAKGGRVRIRAKISLRSKNLLVIDEIPYGSTTQSLIASILSANEKGKLKIHSVEDNTAKNIEILINLPNGTDPEKMISALYAFTECEISLAPAACVIKDKKPLFTTANEILKFNSEHTQQLLQKELEIKLKHLSDLLFRANIEKIFIEERIYRQIEHCKTDEAIEATILKAFSQYNKQLGRSLITEDITYLVKLPIKRISAFDADKANMRMKELESQIVETKQFLTNVTEYTIEWFKMIKLKYGKSYPRKSILTEFESVNATEVIMANETLYLNAAEGFAGYGLKKDVPITKCSQLDDILFIDAQGNLTVTKVKEKFFVGPKPLFVHLFNADSRDKYIYTLAYTDGQTGRSYIKKFTIGGITRDKAYPLTLATEGTRVLYFHVGAAEPKHELVVTLKPAPRLKKLKLEFDLSTLAVKGRSSQGNRITDHAIASIKPV